MNYSFYERLTNRHGKFILGYSSSLMDAARNGIDYSSKRLTHYKSHRQRLWEAQKGICWWCKCQCHFDGIGGQPKEFTVDHIIPLFLGETNHWRNMVGSCYTCNNKRGSTWHLYKNIRLNKQEIYG